MNHVLILQDLLPTRPRIVRGRTANATRHPTSQQPNQADLSRYETFARSS